jgi:hypothetical protein
MWYIYTMEYYSAFKKKKKKTMKFTGKWMNLEKRIILNEVTQTSKGNSDM